MYLLIKIPKNGHSSIQRLSPSFNGGWVTICVYMCVYRDVPTDFPTMIAKIPSNSEFLLIISIKR